MSAHTMLETLVAAGGNTVAALAVKATLTMLAALLLIRLARGASASLRHLLAAASFGVLLLLPLAGLVVPERQITVTPRAVESAPATEAVASAAHASTQPATRGASTSPAPTRGLRGVGPLSVLYGVYLLGVIGIGVSLLAGIGRLQRMRRDAEVSIPGTRLANETARHDGLAGGIEVAVSTELAVPITFGWSHPVILLPAEAADWEPAEMRRAIRHELEHIARGDWATHILSRVALALYWPHPFVWALWRRLRLEAERACDDAVIRSQGQAEPYAEQLVSLARRLRGRGAVPALSMATRSTLGHRVEAILDGRLRRAPRSRATALIAIAAGIACVLTIAPLRVVFAQQKDSERRVTVVTEVKEGRDDEAIRDGIAGAIAEGAEAIADGIGADAIADGIADALDEDDDGSIDMALLNAAERGDIGRMQRLLDQGAKAGAILQGDGTPLIAAARAGRLDAIELLLDKGADVNRGVHGDGNALTMAAQAGHLDAVRLLLDRGADIDLGVPGDGNPLIMAAGAGQLEVVKFLVEKGASLEKYVPGDENALIHASEGGEADVVRYLLGKGADVNARVWAEAGPNRGRGEWRTALLMARRYRHAEVVRILLEAGARE